MLEFIPCGLFFDIAGVLLLGYAFFAKSKRAIIEEAGTYWDSNPHVMKGIIASKFDGIAGTILLFIGFVLQMLGYADVSQRLVVTFLYAFLICFLIIYFVVYRTRAIKAWVARLQEMEREQAP